MRSSVGNCRRGSCRAGTVSSKAWGKACPFFPDIHALKHDFSLQSGFFRDPFDSVVLWHSLVQIYIMGIDDTKNSNSALLHPNVTVNMPRENNGGWKSMGDKQFPPLSTLVLLVGFSEFSSCPRILYGGACADKSSNLTRNREV